MATTYKKALITIDVTTLHGTTFQVADTASSSMASQALAEFEHGGIMHLQVGSDLYEVPFHAVDSIQVTKSVSGDISKSDPYYCEPSSDESSES